MDLKSIILNKKMKFSLSISNRNFLYLDYLDDVQDILVHFTHYLKSIYLRIFLSKIYWCIPGIFFENSINTPNIIKASINGYLQ